MKINEKYLKRLKEEVFVNSNEEVKTILGNSYLKDFIENKRISTGCVVVTDKRIYSRGKAFTMKKMKMKTSYSTKIVDIKDVTGTGTNTRFRLGLVLILALLASYIVNVTIDVPSLVFNSEGQFRVYHYFPMLLLTTPIFIIVFIWGLKSKFTTNMLEVNYAGGTIGYNTSWYSVEEVNEFMRVLRKQKDLGSDDKKEEKTEPVDKEVNVEAKDRLEGKVEERLMNLLKLKQEGVLSDEEFNKLKEEIIRS